MIAPLVARRGIPFFAMADNAVRLLMHVAHGAMRVVEAAIDNRARSRGLRYSVFGHMVAIVLLAKGIFYRH